MKNEKILHGFSFSKNIANFEAFLLVFKLTKNPLFLKSEHFSLNFQSIGLFDQIKRLISYLAVRLDFLFNCVFCPEFKAVYRAQCIKGGKFSHLR